MMRDLIKGSDIVYISGPMTGIPDANRAEFEKAEKFLTKRFGCKVLNPAYMPDGLTYRQYMAHALQLLTHATVIVLLPGFKDSLGASIELLIAERDGLRCMMLEPENASL